MDSCPVLLSSFSFTPFGLNKGNGRNIAKGAMVYIFLKILSFWLTSLCIMGSSFTHLIKTVAECKKKKKMFFYREE